jgi:FtsZ-binding cell division protein ZapB
MSDTTDRIDRQEYDAAKLNVRTLKLENDQLRKELEDTKRKLDEANSYTSFLMEENRKNDEQLRALIVSLKSELAESDKALKDPGH